MCPPLTFIAVLGPTASGKSALALGLAERLGGEIVGCDSVAVYRGFDIGADKVPVDQRRGVPHHLIDVADPTEEYTAARYGQEAAAAIAAIAGRGRLPIVAGGTGFYFRALTRGLFPGPGRDPALRARLGRLAERRGIEFLHRMVRRVDPASAVRIQPRDALRLVRALEVFFLTGRPLSDHFAATASPLPGARVAGLLIEPPADERSTRIAARVAEQFRRGLVDEVRGLLASGVPRSARPLGALGYRQVVDLLQGRCDEAEAREAIVRETRQYARRQLIWFRKEPNLDGIRGPGDRLDVLDAATRAIVRRLRSFATDGPDEETG